jgi:hypothetical protein
MSVNAPDLKENPEAARYREVWKHAKYRDIAPGETAAMTFLSQAKPPPDAECIDFGCGTGRGALMLALMGRLKVTMLDFADNCLDEDIANACKTQPDRIKFCVADLTRHIPTTAPFGFCTDVMEHIPTDDVPTVLSNILGTAQHVFFAICTAPDYHGPELLGEGEHLHLTVKPMDWWQAELNKAGAIIHWGTRDDELMMCYFYVSGWKDARDVLPDGVLNTSLETVNAQTAENIKAGWKHAQPYDRQNREVVILAGGPSLAENIDEIRRLRDVEGAAIVTTNGAYEWALEQGLKVSMQIVVDAREFNARFTRRVVDDCLYLIASQVHPKTLEGLPHERTFLWHSGISDDNEKLVIEKSGHFFPIPGGSTVILRAIPLLRMLGFWRQHLFGFDSCVKRIGSAHHSYVQAENDGEHIFAVGCGGKQFFCAPWMVQQASEFRGLVKSLADIVELNVVGDGLIAHMIQTGADLQELSSEPVPT